MRVHRAGPMSPVLQAHGLVAPSAVAALVLLAVLVVASPGLRAQAGGIYTCIDDKGRRLTSDRPIPECLAKEQRVLNRDGSLKEVRPPALSPEERAQKEARDRQQAEQRAAQAELARRDRNLLQRYHDEAAHRRARDAALEPTRSAQASLQGRVAELNRERKPLLAEAEFYKGQPLPPRLKARIDANDAALAALRDSAAAQQAEVARIEGLYDLELDRLRRLWAGAPPGSLGPLQPPTAPAGAPPARR